MYQNLMIKLILTSLLLFLSGCEVEDEQMTLQEIARENIIQYAKNLKDAPTLQTYKEAGIEGVNLLNIERINAKIKSLPPQTIDSVAKLLVIVKSQDITQFFDTTKPTITLHGESNITIEQFSNYTKVCATAIDDVDGNLTVYVLDDVNTSKLGLYRVKYSAVDKSNNLTEIFRLVRVIERDSSTEETPPTSTENNTTKNASEDNITRETIEIINNPTSADNSSTIILSVQLIKNKIVQANQTVNFILPSPLTAIPSSSCITEENGICSIDIKTKKAGEYLIRIEEEATKELIGTATITFNSGPISITNSKLLSVTNNAPADGISKNAFRATIADEFDNPISGEVFLFSTDPLVTLSDSSCTTNSLGECALSATSFVAGEYNLTISLKRASFLSRDLTFSFSTVTTPPSSTIITPTLSLSNSRFDITKNNALSDTVDLNKILITLKDTNNDSMPNQTVNFIPSSNFLSLSQSSCITDNNGECLLLIQSSLDGNFTIETTLSSGESLNSTTINFVAPSLPSTLYKVGGTVENLPLNHTITLDINAEEQLTLTGTGNSFESFSFLKNFADTTSYSVTIDSTSSGIACDLTSSNGVISGIDVTDIQVICHLIEHQISFNINWFSVPLPSKLKIKSSKNGISQPPLLIDNPQTYGVLETTYSVGDEYNLSLEDGGASNDGGCFFKFGDNNITTKTVGTIDNNDLNLSIECQG